jgi:hypothetical protein
MQLWQLDIMGGVLLIDGRELKLISGTDDHSRFVVIASLVMRASARAVCAAFAQALSDYGVPLRYQHMSAKGDRVIADGLDALVQAAQEQDDSDDDDGAAGRLVPVA